MERKKDSFNSSFLRGVNLKTENFSEIYRQLSLFFFIYALVVTIKNRALENKSGARICASGAKFQLRVVTIRRINSFYLYPNQTTPKSLMQLKKLRISSLFFFHFFLLVLTMSKSPYLKFLFKDYTLREVPNY